MVDRVILAHIDSIDTSARRCLRLELVKGKYLLGKYGERAIVRRLMSACYFDDHMPNRCRTSSDGDGGRMLPSNHGVTVSFYRPTTHHTRRPSLLYRSVLLSSLINIPYPSSD
jgi:hypothetical protein